MSFAEVLVQRLRSHHVFTAALAVRLLFILGAAYTWPEKLDIPIYLSGGEIGHIAFNLFQGRGFSSPFELGSQPTAWICPVVPAVWASVLNIANGDSAHATLGIWTIQAIVSSVSALLYFHIFQRITRKNVSPAALAVFGGLVAFWPESILRITELWYYVWQELGVAMLVWLGMRWAEHQTLRNSILLGIVGGLTALVNISPMLLFVIAVCVPVVRSFSHNTVRRAILTFSISTLIVAPWTVRNIFQFGRFIPLRGNGGFELLQGNNPQGSIRETIQTVHPAKDAAELLSYQTLGEVQYNQQAFRQAMQWIRAHPFHFIRNVALRAYVIWFTDITDAWSWTGGKWWRSSRFRMLLHLITKTTALVTIALAVTAMLGLGVRALPHAHLLAGAPLLVPLPHYFTQIEDSYVSFVRVWLILVASVLYCVSRARKIETVESSRPSAHTT